jgi:hypothetical protein
VLFKSFHHIFFIWMTAGVVLLSACIPAPPATSTPVQFTPTSVQSTMTPIPMDTEQILSPTPAPGVLYEQPVDPNGKLLLSSRRDPDGSDYDEYVWEDFMLPAGGTVSEIGWYGVYDPAKFGKGGPVLEFQVSIYSSISAGTEPAVAGQPLVKYQIGGNAGETAVGTVGTTALYQYTFTLPNSFSAFAGEKYWVQIEASQQGPLPDWCLAAGTGGDERHYWRGSGAGGDIMYRSVPGDAAFSLR